MALKKSELYSSLWQSCDALRGGMDASQYKVVRSKQHSQFEKRRALARCELRL